MRARTRDSAPKAPCCFCRRVSPALQNVDSSSGAIGSAVNRAIDALAPLIAKSPADLPTRRKWLEQLYQAHADDAMPYIELLGDHWGELCASPELAAEWADALVDTVDTMWSRYSTEHGFFHGTSMCLSALLAAGRHDRLLALLDKCPYRFWSYHQWGVQALIAAGRKTEALRYAEASRGLNEPVGLIAQACEAILLSSGLADEAYARYAFDANQAGTYLATFRGICRKYPDKPPESILQDLVARTPGDEGKWFAAAKDAGHYDLAVTLARKSPVDHRTLTRAAKDFAQTEPQFAVNCALMALYWICAGRAYDVTAAEILTAYDHMLHAAEYAQCSDSALKELRRLLDGFPQDQQVKRALAGKAALWGRDPAA